MDTPHDLEPMKQRIVVAMSGGVDSSVAAARMQDQGFEVVGLTLHLWETTDPDVQSRCCAPEDVREAQRVADQLGFPHYSFDRIDQFDREIVEPFVNAYLSGNTPSPCAACNQIIKFPTLLRFASLIGANAVATGHYAQTIQTPSGIRVARGLDGLKDQSYFLSTLDARALQMLKLPLGRDTKDNVRIEAIKRKIVGSGKGESQDLCFVPSGSYARFVEQRAPDRVKPGWVVDKSGRRLGSHGGVHKFTLGQRKGLGIAIGKPVFVTAIDADRGLVIVEDSMQNRVSGVVIGEPRVAAGVEFPVSATLQVRYRDTGTRAMLERDADGSVRAVFNEPVRAACPGQLAVGYVGEEVVVGGTISRVVGL